MKVFRLFRHKKCGEPLEPEQDVNELIEENDDESDQIYITKRNLPEVNQDDLDTVLEEEESVADSD